jgi:hypothetical protein
MQICAHPRLRSRSSKKENNIAQNYLHFTDDEWYESVRYFTIRNPRVHDV